MPPYDHKKIEKKWQHAWEKAGLYRTDENSIKPKKYVLDMFPYPSGEGLHVGHPKGYIATDIYSRMKCMQGFNILHPMGWDAFGLPAEQYAIKNKVHPRVAVDKNTKHYKEQLSVMGFNYDWSREINTTDPEFYKWTQWIFLKMFEKGLAYESYEPINWCPTCQTGLANEDLEGGKCERCDTIVEKKPMRQWVLRITDYADRMLADIDALDWPASIKESQRNWIGRNYGVKYKLKVKGKDTYIETYSTHYEAFFADTFAVIASDHKLLPELVGHVSGSSKILERAKEISILRNGVGFKADEICEGIFTGVYLEDPITKRDLPLWVSSYALADYGTGIIKCSAHDQRDFIFAKKYGIDLATVLLPDDDTVRAKVKNQEICFSDFSQAIITEPEEFKNRRPHEARSDIANYIENNGWGTKSTQYKLKDWVFSRQRYWGEPFPLIHCVACGVVPVPEKDLPVILPQVESYAPSGTGESPLADILEWVNVSCPKCGDLGKRETNTMPQWAGSSWYYLRYIDPRNTDLIVNKEKEAYWSPVDTYVGGAEHATRHLIYARFYHKFLYDIGVVNYEEPFRRLQNVGLVMAEDGRKMSKRWGNVINPDDVVMTYGADTLRLYEMFMGPFGQAVAWNTESIIGPRRFLERVWRLSEKVDVVELQTENYKLQTSLLHQTIKKVTEDIEAFGFNTAISALMILANEITKAENISREHYEIFLKLLAPFAPHITEELWYSLGNTSSIHSAEWPVFDAEKIIFSEATIAIQVNGKVRDTMVVQGDIDDDTIRLLGLGRPGIIKWIDNKIIKKTIIVKGKLLSIVTE